MHLYDTQYQYQYRNNFGCRICGSNRTCEQFGSHYRVACQQKRDGPFLFSSFYNFVEKILNKQIAVPRSSFSDPRSPFPVPRIPFPIPIVLFSNSPFLVLEIFFFSSFRQIPPSSVGFCKVRELVCELAVGEMFICSKITAKSFGDGSQDIFKDTVCFGGYGRPSLPLLTQAMKRGEKKNLIIFSSGFVRFR